MRAERKPARGRYRVLVMLGHVPRGRYMMQISLIYWTHTVRQRRWITIRTQALSQRRGPLPARMGDRAFEKSRDALCDVSTLRHCFSPCAISCRARSTFA